MSKSIRKGDSVLVDFINKQTGVEGEFKIEITEDNPNRTEVDFIGRRREDDKEVYVSKSKGESGEVGVSGHVDVEWIGELSNFRISKDF